MSRIIKRYANRKLYDTEKKGYISLEGISLLIREGIEIKVIDNKTGKDITNYVLSQIIVEESKSGTNLLSTENLSDLIRRGSDTVKNSVDALHKNITGIIPKVFSSNKEKAKKDEKDEKDEISELKAKLNDLEKRMADFINKDSKKKK